MRTSEFAFFQSISQLFLPTYFVKCRRTLLELNSWAPYPNTVREIKFVRCLFTSSIKREIRHVHVVVVQKRAEKCTKSLLVHHEPHSLLVGFDPKDCWHSVLMEKTLFPQRSAMIQICCCVLSDLRHPRFWNLQFTVSIDVIRVTFG